MSQQKVALISGCSSGIGNALVRELDAAGWKVIATARNPKTIQGLKSRSVDVMALDVTDAASIKKCVASVMNTERRIDLLVNNAGYGLMGPLAEIPITDVRVQFETNVLGLVALTQAVLPGMLQRKSGMIVNIGSVSGVLTTPFGGAYSATKSAVHMLSDAMRMELAPFGIRVITVQPGSIKSNFGSTALKSASRFHGRSMYYPIAGFIEKRAMSSQEKPTDAEEFARILVKKLSMAKPPAVIRIGNDSFKVPFLNAVLPRFMRDRVLTKMFGLNQL